MSIKSYHEYFIKYFKLLFTGKATVMTKQQRIEQLEEQLEEAYEIIRQMKKDADEGFKASPEYNRMEQEIKSLALSQSLAEHHIESEIRSDRRLMQEIKKIREDNIALCAEHDVDYWEGITQIDRWTERDFEKKIAALEAKIAAKDVIIEHLKDLLGGRDPLAPKETVMGRKPVPDEQKKRIRSYRRKGWKLKEISELEGVSIGAVSGICKGIKGKNKQEKPCP